MLSASRGLRSPDPLTRGIAWLLTIAPGQGVRGSGISENDGAGAEREVAEWKRIGQRAESAAHSLMPVVENEVIVFVDD